MAINDTRAPALWAALASTAVTLSLGTASLAMLSSAGEALLQIDVTQLALAAPAQQLQRSLVPTEAKTGAPENGVISVQS